MRTAIFKGMTFVSERRFGYIIALSGVAAGVCFGQGSWLAGFGLIFVATIVENLIAVRVEKTFRRAAMDIFNAELLNG